MIGHYSEETFIGANSDLIVIHTLADAFREAVAAHADLPAIATGTWTPTYAQLDSASNCLAERLQGSDERVAILARLDGPLIGALLGARKSGRTAVVLNPQEPVERLKALLRDLHPARMVADVSSISLAQQLSAGGGITLFDPYGRGSLREAAEPQRAAVLVQTSGSSGLPKWVMQTDRSILSNVARHSGELEIGPGDRVLLAASPSGNQALATIFSTLLGGGTLCPYPVAERGVGELGPWLIEHSVTVFVSAASLFRGFVNGLRGHERFPRIRLVKLGAERILGKDLERGARHLPKNCVYYCGYSCAEAGNLMQLRLECAGPIPDGQLPLGRPSPGVEVKLSEKGEVLVRGEGFSDGYWKNEFLTEERFIELPGEGPGLWYRTRDLARQDRTGQYWSLGRADRTAKINGNAVSLSEVEEALERLPGVAEAAVEAVESAGGGTQMHAHVTAKAGFAPSPDDLRLDLSRTLPGYMVPTHILVLDRMPLNAHGKLDRARLREAERLHPTEETLVAIWEAVLKGPRPQPDSNFFELGGDSLAAAALRAKVRSQLRVDLEYRQLAAHPTLRELARHLDALQQTTDDLPPLERTQQRGLYPLSFAQASIWKHSQTDRAHRLYTVARSYALRGPLDVEALRAAFSILHQRHEVLRTRFPQFGANAAALVDRPTRVEVPFVDLSRETGARQKAVAMLSEDAGPAFDLARGPVLRLRLIRLSAEEHWLNRVNHQILSDAWLWKLYFAELEKFYLALSSGKDPAAEEPHVQHGDYAAWEQRNFRAGFPHRRALAEWWKIQLKDQKPAMKLPFAREGWARFFQRPRPSDGKLSHLLDATVRQGLTDLARTENTTVHAIGLAIFCALLAQASGEPRVVVGTHFSSRSALELQGMLGNFSHLMPVSVNYEPSLPVRAWLAQVHAKAAEIQSHARVPYEELRGDLLAARQNAPEIQAIFGGPAVVTPAKFAGIGFEMLPHGFKGQVNASGEATAMPWGLTLSLDVSHPQRPVEITFNAKLHDRVKIASFLERYVTALRSVAANPGQTLAELASVPEENPTL